MADFDPTLGMIAAWLLLLAAFLLGFEYFWRRPRLPVTRRLDHLSRYREHVTHGTADDLDDDLAGEHNTNSVSEFIVNGLRFLNQTFGSMVTFSEQDQAKVRLSLIHAGLRSADGLNLLFTAKAVCMFVGVVAAISGEWLAEASEIDPVVYWCIAVPGVILFAAVPEKFIGFMAQKRQEKIAIALPDALDLMIICTNAGYSLDVTIARVCREIRGFAKEMAEELRITSGELRVLANRREALDNLVARTDVSGVRSLVAALNQAQRYGTPISQSLRTTAAELRSESILAIEEWAGRIPAKMTIPIVLFILPSMFLLVAGPSFVQIMRSL